MKKSIGLFFVFSTLVWSGFTQVVTNTFVSTTGAPVEDAMVGNGGLINTNMADLDVNNVSRDDNTTPIIYRTFIQFDLTTIPRNATLLSATLKLVPQTISSTNFDYSIERVAESWDKNTLTWNNQPPTNLSDILKVDTTTSMDTTLQEIDVYKHVYYMLKTPFFNNGWCIKLWDESITGVDYGNTFYTSDHSNTNLRPQLEVTYVMPMQIEGTVTQHCTPGNSDGQIDFTVNGGSQDQLRSFTIYKLDTTSATNSGMSYTSVHNVRSLTGTVNNTTIDPIDLEPGVYLAKAVDSLYGKYPNYGSTIGINYATSKHFFVGREGETTNISFTRDVDHMNVNLDIDGSVSNSEYMNLAGTTTGSNIRTGFTGTNSLDPSATLSYKLETYFDLLADFPSDLLFEKAVLIHGAHYVYQHSTGSNATKLTPCTSDWQEKTIAWNYRPTLDETQAIYKEKSANTNGFTTTNDTLDISPLVDYWQNNPNYGFEMKLQDYNSPRGSYRQYRDFTKINTGRFEASFTVKEPIVATFNDTTGLGSITINAPAGDLPYTYLIGYDTIPDLSVIWNAIKDSVSIDSATFFNGKENSTSHTFHDLKNGVYSVAVFDNSGERIYEDELLLKPVFKYFQNENITVNVEGVVSQTNHQVDGHVTLLASLKKENSGGLLLRVVEVNEGLIGFNEIGDAQIQEAQDMAFGIELDSLGNATVYNNGENQAESFLIANNDELEIIKSEGKFYLYLNNELKYEGDEAGLGERDYKIDFLMRGQADINAQRISLEPTLYRGFVEQVIVPVYQEGSKYCGSVTGIITIENPFSPLELNVTVTNNFTGVQTTYSDNESASISIPLLVGTYTVSYSLSNLSSQVSYPGGSQIVDVGYDISWDLSTNHTIDANGRLRSYPYNSYGESSSVNVLPGNSSGFFSFKVSHLYQAVSYPAPLIVPVTKGELSLYDINDPTQKLIRVKIESIGFNLSSTYLKIDYFNSANPNTNNSQNLTSTYSGFRSLNDNSTYKMTYEPTTSGNGIFKVFENDIELHSNTTSNISLLKVKAETSPAALIFDEKVSFCYELPNQYVQLKRKLEGGYYKVQPDEILKVEYFEEYTDLDQNLKFKIKNKKGETILDNSSVNIASGYGDNRIDFDLSSLSYNQFYILEIMNDKNETFFLRFKK